MAVTEQSAEQKNVKKKHTLISNFTVCVQYIELLYKLNNTSIMCCDIACDIVLSSQFGVTCSCCDLISYAVTFTRLITIQSHLYPAHNCVCL